MQGRAIRRQPRHAKLQSYGWLQVAKRNRGVPRVSISMIIDDLYPVRPFCRPHEADTVLVVDSYAVLAGAIALERFQPIARRRGEVQEGRGPVKDGELA